MFCLLELEGRGKVNIDRLPLGYVGNVQLKKWVTPTMLAVVAIAAKDQILSLLRIE